MIVESSKKGLIRLPLSGSTELGQEPVGGDMREKALFDDGGFIFGTTRAPLSQPSASQDYTSALSISDGFFSMTSSFIYIYFLAHPQI